MLINGCDLTAKQYDQVLAAFGRDGKIDLLWVERHDFTFTPNGVALVFEARPVLNEREAAIQELERQQIMNDEQLFPHLDR